MAKFVVMEVYAVEADSLDSAKASVESKSTNDSVVHVGSSLSNMLNPFHWADAQTKLGHIQPVVEEVAEEKEAPADTE